MKTTQEIKSNLIQVGEARWILPQDGKKPIKIIATDKILNSFDNGIWDQIENVSNMPGVEEVIISPDAHVGFGFPVGCSVVSKTHVNPPAVGVDACCSMSFLQTNLPEEIVREKSVRRALINAVTERIPTGAGNRQVKKSRKINPNLFYHIARYGASPTVLFELGISVTWGEKCERNSFDIEGVARAAQERVVELKSKMEVIGSIGGGNHFVSFDTVKTYNNDIGDKFGLKNDNMGFLTHCGSRGFGYRLMDFHAKKLKKFYETWGIPFPGNDSHLVAAPLNTQEAQDYLADLYIACNFAIVNHLLINSLLLEAVQEVFPGVTGDLVYHIPHNVGQEELIDGTKKWIWRKGATRAFHAGHPQLKGTGFETTGHPILLPGNARDGSVIMAAKEGASWSNCTVNHGAGRRMGRKQAKRELNQANVDSNMLESDILHNGRLYPIDEAPDAYKNFDEITECVEKADLALTVARLRPMFVIKDNDSDPEGAA